MELNPLLLDGARLVAVVLLVLANGFFVAAEFALVTVRKTRIAELIEEGNRSAQWVQRAIEDPDSFIAATQLGITLASLGLGWIGEPALSRLLDPVISLFPEQFQTGLSHGLSAALAFAIITFLHVVIGELAPKSLALEHPERTSLVVARPTAFFEWLFKPAIWVLNGAGNLLLRAIGIEPAAHAELVHSVGELRMLVAASAESGIVAVSEYEMVDSVFNFRQTLVRQVMTPRTEVIAVPADATLEEVLDTSIEHSVSKVPVYGEDLDNILGVVHMKDVIRSLQSEHASAATARDVMRDTVFVPEAASISTLLQVMRARNRHMAIVLDEYGGTAGVVSLEDLLEEIFGEVSDPFDRGPEIQELPDGSSLIDGLTTIDDVNSRFNLSLEDPDYDTIAGYVLGKLGRLATLGDTVVVDGTRMRVVAMDGKRVARIWLRPGDPEPVE